MFLEFTVFSLFLYGLASSLAFDAIGLDMPLDT